MLVAGLLAYLFFKKAVASKPMVNVGTKKVAT